MADALSDGQLREVARYVAEDLRGEFRAILQATAQAPAIPPPNKPPVSFDGLDAKLVERLKLDILRDTRDLIREKTDEFVPDDEIEERFKQRQSDIARQFENLKTDLLRDVRDVVHDECEKLRVEFFRIFDDLDMPLEEGEHRKATRAKLSGVFAMHAGSKEFRSELWKGIRGAVIGQITLLFFAFLAFLGYKGGQPH